MDIGAIEHDMSPLSDLNLMANEVVRTIIGRANKYGRVVMIDDIGYFIRMSIVGLSFVILGLFTIFFVKFVPLAVGVIISVIGIIIAAYYIVKVIVKSIDMFRKTPRGNLVKSFIKIHFPMIISIIVLLLMISTFIGAAHFEHGVLSIEPNSRNLIIYADDTPSDSSISVRGPYTIDTAIENESSIIRMPSDAMMTLGLGVNDTIKINGETYKINETRPGEPDILRLPINAKNALDVESGDIIQNSRLNEIFEKSAISHAHHINNTTVYEKFIISGRYNNATSFEVFINNESAVYSTGIFKENSTYDLAIDGEYITSVKFPENKSLKYKNNTLSIEFKDTNSTSIKQYSSSGNILSFYFN